MGSTSSDRVGIHQLYDGFADAGLAIVAGMTGPIPDLTPGAVNNPLTTLSQLLTKVMDGIDNTLATGNTTDLLLDSRLLNRLIGTVAGNTGAFGSTSHALTLLYYASVRVLECFGISTTEFTDVRITYRARLNGILNDIIKFIQDNARAIPVIGRKIVNPPIAVPKSILSDFQKGVPLAVAETLAIFDEFITGIPEGCAEGPSPCMGIFMTLKIVGTAALNMVVQIPVAGAMAMAILPGIINGILDAIATGSRDAIDTAHDALIGPVEALEAIPGIGNLAKPFRYLLDIAQALLDCLAGSPTSVTVS
ncbi:hypothetical protein BGX34_000019 [Mortierella sp. NVP85]|nr:hypothetical protein BGX34_000019 [Mortierella sp. NVP85]